MRTLCLLLTLAMAPGCYAQLIGSRSIVNAASFMAPGLPAGAIARGSIFSIFGGHLGPASSPPLAFPLSTTLGGVSITVTQGTTAVNAIPLYVSAGQINCLVPYATQGSTATIVVQNGSAAGQGLGFGHRQRHQGTALARHRGERQFRRVRSQ